MKQSTIKTQGFTLIELSIVLVIIGLIVGGVLVGRDLIYAAQIRKVGTELQQLSTAITTFRGKYDCLPGDCANATSFFGVSSNGCPTGQTNTGRTGTCNGNGDGFVQGWWVPSGGFGGVESVYVLQQLSLARLVPGTYWGGAAVGVVSDASNSLEGPRVIQVSSFNQGIGYYPFTMHDGVASILSVTGINNKLVIQIGGVVAGQDFLYPGFNAPQAMAIDTKTDDGRANAGKITSWNATQASVTNANTTCRTGTDYSTSIATGCVMYYVTDVP